MTCHASISINILHWLLIMIDFSLSKLSIPFLNPHVDGVASVSRPRKTWRLVNCWMFLDQCWISKLREGLLCRPFLCPPKCMPVLYYFFPSTKVSLVFRSFYSIWSDGARLTTRQFFFPSSSSSIRRRPDANFLLVFFKIPIVWESSQKFSLGSERKKLKR